MPRKNKSPKPKIYIKHFLTGGLYGICALIIGVVGLLLWKNSYPDKFPSFSQNHFSTVKKINFRSINEQKNSLSLIPTPSPPATNPVVKTPETGYCLNVPVLLYHHIEPYAQAQKASHAQLTVDSLWFDKQMAYLVEKGYTTINADQLAQALRTHQGLPPKSIVITLDDGYIDAYTYAFPIAQKYNIILNLMIPTGLMGNSDYLTWDYLKQMVGSGLVYAYDHTWSHASLGNAPLTKIEYEIMTAKKQLEDHLGKPVNIFTYPYGSESNAIINFLKANGFTAAYSTIPGFLQCDSSIMSLHRNHIGNAPLSSYGL